MKNRKKPEADLRSYYTIFLQTGMIVALLIFIVAVKLDLTSPEPEEYVLNEQEVIEMEDIIRTEQIETPPPPPRPPQPVSVPDDEVIEDMDINIDADLDFGSTLEMPPPPPDAEEDEDDYFVAVEQMPELIGGQAELQSKLNYPDVARRANIEGTVVVQFIVNEQGEVENPQVISGVHSALDQEALRAVREEARFIPGRQRGRAVRVQYSVPIIFRLTN